MDFDLLSVALLPQISDFSSRLCPDNIGFGYLEEAKPSPVLWIHLNAKRAWIRMYSYASAGIAGLYADKYPDIRYPDLRPPQFIHGSGKPEFSVCLRNFPVNLLGRRRRPVGLGV